MDESHRKLRKRLSIMSPKRAILFIREFDLPEDEERCLIECDVRGKSCIQVSDLLHISPEGVKRRKRKAYQKMTDGIEEG